MIFVEPQNWQYWISVKGGIVKDCKTVSFTDADADEVFHYPVAVSLYETDPRLVLSLNEVKEWKKESIFCYVMSAYIDSIVDKYFMAKLQDWIVSGNTEQKSKCYLVKNWMDSIWDDETYGYVVWRTQVYAQTTNVGVIAIQPTVLILAEHFTPLYPLNCSFWEIAASGPGNFGGFWNAVKLLPSVYTKIQTAITSVWDVNDFVFDVSNGPQSEVNPWFATVDASQTFTAQEKTDINAAATSNDLSVIFS
jgi:hypothetical protein